MGSKAGLSNYEARNSVSVWTQKRQVKQEVSDMVLSDIRTILGVHVEVAQHHSVFSCVSSRDARQHELQWCQASPPSRPWKYSGYNWCRMCIGHWVDDTHSNGDAGDSWTLVMELFCLDIPYGSPVLSYIPLCLE